MPYAVVIQPRATFDMRRAVAWLIKHVSPITSARWQTRIIKAVHSLAARPDRCPEADEAADLGCELRVLLSGCRPHVYRILFTIDGVTVNVIRIPHAARDRVDPDVI